LELLILPEGSEERLVRRSLSRGLLLLDYSGRLSRAHPESSLPAIGSEGIGQALADLTYAMAAGTNSGVCAYSLSALWALAYMERGLRGSVTGLTSFALRAREASRVFNRQLCIVAEKWLQDRHSYVYNIYRYAADTITIVRSRSPPSGPITRPSERGRTP